MSGLILAIEDNLVQQKLYRLLCARFRFDCIVVDNTAEACTILRSGRKKPSIILIDWILENESGLAALAPLKEIMNHQAYRIPIIAITANAFDSDRIACLAAGA